MKPNLIRELRKELLGPIGPKSTGLERSALMGAIAALAVQHGGLNIKELHIAFPFAPLPWPNSRKTSSEEIILAFESWRAELSKNTLGMHYTPMCAVEETLRLVATRRPLSDMKRICDPSCGAGAFFLGVLRRASNRDQLAKRVYGFDIDPDALAVARLIVQLEAGRLIAGIESRIRLESGLEALESLRFDLIVGNPPWVSYSGRHAAEISPPDAARLAERFASFKNGWPTLHGPFLEASSNALSEDGVLAMVVPQQIAEFEGFSVLREELRRNLSKIEIHPLLEGTFQGISTRAMIIIGKSGAEASPSGESFSVNSKTKSRNAALDTLFERLSLLPKAPSSAFGDIGIHSGNAAKLLFNRDGDGTPIHEGADIRAQAMIAPSIFLGTKALRKIQESDDGHYFRLGDLERQRATPVLIRQTARFPIAALNSFMAPFRNSCLAGFGTAGWSAEAFCAWLNSPVVAWFHLRSVAESRQRAFPQVKVSALRALPLPEAVTSSDGLIAAAQNPKLMAKLWGISATLMSALIAEQKSLISSV